MYDMISTVAGMYSVRGTGASLTGLTGLAGPAGLTGLAGLAVTRPKFEPKRAHTRACTQHESQLASQTHYP